MIITEQDAAHVNKTARQIAQAILDRRAKLDREGYAHIPLAVIFGEYHDCPTHIVCQMAVQKHIHQFEPTLSAVEISDNILEHNFKRSKRTPITPLIRTLLRNKDRGSQLSLMAWEAFPSTFYAPHTNETYARFLNDPKNNMHVCLNDAASIEGSLDCSSPSVQLGIAQAHKDGAVEYPIGVASPLGMALRNDHMAYKALEFAQQQNSRIIFQRSGAQHVVGSVSDHYPADQSLSHVFRLYGSAVMVIPFIENTQDIPQNHRLSREELQLCTNLATGNFRYNVSCQHAPHEREVEVVKLLTDACALPSYADDIYECIVSAKTQEVTLREIFTDTIHQQEYWKQLEQLAELHASA